jgi:hypothetical protein
MVFHTNCCFRTSRVCTHVYVIFSRCRNVITTSTTTEQDYDIVVRLAEIDEMLTWKKFSEEDLATLDDKIKDFKKAAFASLFKYLRKGPNLEALDHWSEMIRWLGPPW